MSLRQQNATCGDTVRDKTTGQLLCSLLAALVLINIEGEIDGALAFTQLPELVCVKVRTQRAGHVVEPRLTQGSMAPRSLLDGTVRGIERARTRPTHNARGITLPVPSSSPHHRRPAGQSPPVSTHFCFRYGARRHQPARTDAVDGAC